METSDRVLKPPVIFCCFEKKRMDKTQLSREKQLSEEHLDKVSKNYRTATIERLETR